MKKNILLLATHWSYYIPFFLRFFLNKSFKKNNDRLLKNFSDFWTKYLVLDFENKIICNFSRALWDPNRDIKAWDLFMDKDFNWNNIWKIKLPNFLKNILIKKYYKSYHNSIQNKINKLEKNNSEVIIFDIHDTWNELLWIDFDDDKKRDYHFPEINIWTSWYKTCTKEFTDKLSWLFLKEFWINPKIDWPYVWWFVSKKYWIWFKNRQVVQIEFGRYLYMNEKTQEIDFNKINDIKDKFIKVIKDIGK